ncbi:MAG: Ppx/GppA family phosphatase [Kiloniellales bacterium]
MAGKTEIKKQPGGPTGSSTQPSSAGSGNGSGRYGRRIAVVDIGSNSIRLVVFDRPGRVPLPVFNERVICGLGKGLAQSGRLSAEGKASALPTLLRFARLAEAMQVAEVVLLATAAVRDAEDGPAFVEEAESHCGYPIRILDGEQEAILAAYGVLVGIPQADGFAGDLGGGSLELIELNQGQLGRRVTLPLGPLRLMDSSEGDRSKARALVRKALGEVPWLDEMAGRNFYAVGGAWRNMARVHMQQIAYPLHVIQHYAIGTDAAVELSGVIAQQGKRSLSKTSAVSRRRVETLPFAAIALAGVLQRTRPMQVVFSSFGLREGLLYEGLSSRERSKDPLLLIAEDFAKREARFPNLGKALLDWLTPVYIEVRGLERRLVAAACHLGDVAWREHPDYRAPQALSRLLYYPYAGLDHPGRAFLGLAAYLRYGGNMEDDDAAGARALLSAVARHEARLLGLGIRLAYSVCGGAPPVLARTKLTIVGRRLRLRLPEDGSLPPGGALSRRHEALAQAMGLEGTQLVFDEDEGTRLTAES